jgi:hypothetical protein
MIKRPTSSDRFPAVSKIKIWRKILIIPSMISISQCLWSQRKARHMSMHALYYMALRLQENIPRANKRVWNWNGLNLIAKTVLSIHIWKKNIYKTDLNGVNRVQCFFCYWLYTNMYVACHCNFPCCDIIFLVETYTLCWYLVSIILFFGKYMSLVTEPLYFFSF